MQNKALKRIFKKGFGVSSVDEFQQHCSEILGIQDQNEKSIQLTSFFESLNELIDHVDKALIDFERVIDIRERTISVNSLELTVMNNEIQIHSNRQASVLARLQSTIGLVSNVTLDVNNENDTRENDLEKLVEKVEHLVKSQLDSVKFQQLLFEEGVLVCSVLNFKSLEKQVASSIQKLTQSRINVELYFSGGFFENKNKIEFYQCNEFNMPLENRRVSEKEYHPSTQLIRVDSPKGNGPLALISIELIGEIKKNEINYNIAQISPLVPSIASTLENIRLLKQEKEKQNLENELNTVRLVQNTLLPPTAPIIKSKEIEVSGFYQSASECSGDWWSYFKSIDDRHFILIGDVTGHGTASAMVCAVVKGYCDSFLNRSDIKVSALLKELNSVVFQSAQGGHRIMTMAVIAIDTKLGVATYSNAGHPAPILIQGKGDHKTSSSLNLVGPILGLQAEAEFKEISFPYNFGDKIVCYSDGLTEGMNKQETMYGENRLMRLIRSTEGSEKASDLIQLIIQDFQDFSTGEALKDDITAVVVRNLAKAL